MDEDSFLSIFDSIISYDQYTQDFFSAHLDVEKPDSEIKCEIAEYDCIKNTEGQLVTVRSGSKLDVLRVDDEHAIARTTHWDTHGTKDFVATTIQSPYMKQALRAVVPQYKNRNVAFHITYNGVPRFLFHFRDKLFRYGKDLEKGSIAQRHVSLLVEHIQKELSDAILAYTSHVKLSSSPSIDFVHLWTLFKPDDLVYISALLSPDLIELVVKYKSMYQSCSCDDASHYFNHTWQFLGDVMDSNGTFLGTCAIPVTIRYFEGFREMSKLSLLPLRLHPLKDDIITRMTARGRKFTELQGCHYRHYTGMARLLWGSRHSKLFEVGPSNSEILTMVNGGIMIDPATYRETHPEILDNMLSLTSTLNQEQLMMCRGRIPAFSFSERKWGLFEVTRVGPMQLDGSIFHTSLMLDKTYKDMLLSLVQMQSPKSGEAFGDIIKGKSQGVVFLLHGEPGVGKTLTAETIADSCGRPLLRINADNLINSKESVENALARALNLSERWKAVALIDEADIFLEQRSRYCNTRNSFVTGLLSIYSYLIDICLTRIKAFLRILEYYRGILFLTTNRVNSFDRALKSRIQVAIHYPALDAKSRKELWQIFLSKASATGQPKDIWADIAEKFASEVLNGRQIRDSVRIAQASALGEGTEIETRHLNNALQLLRKFEDEFEKGRLEEDRPRKRPRRARYRDEDEYGDEDEDEDEDEEY
ncbi:unnamed protein product [Clonostachys byssicola]|uniref:AAA+ ATPase domain-containing protein n=1 Tax=Clonostachys byssicola TaxID=160290 RepID=A0A9N9U7A4_9HYPO|nr:unnamed protein product [Clonostachys byssicola]